MSTYEFNDKENQMFTAFSQRLQIFSFSLVGAGLLFVILSLIPDFSWSDLVAGLIMITIGIALFLPIRNFKNIVHSEGNDIKELVEGFNVLGKGFNYVIYATIALILLMTIGFFSSSNFL